MLAKVNGIQMDYSLDGRASRPVVALVHGFPFTRAAWKPQVAALKREFRVLTYDLRGLGASGLGRPPLPLEAYVDDLLALLDHLRIGQVALAGLSMGGYIALRAAERAPQRLWALALCDTRADADSDEGKLKRAAAILAIRAKGAAAFAKGMLPNLLAAATLETKPAVARGLLRLMQSNQADGMANAQSAMAGRTDTTAALPHLGFPVQVLVGELDKIAPPAVAEAMAAAIPGARLAVLPGVGHVSNLEAPEEFNRVLLEFLRHASTPPNGPVFGL